MAQTQAHQVRGAVLMQRSARRLSQKMPAENLHHPTVTAQGEQEPSGDTAQRLIRQPPDLAGARLGLAQIKPAILSRQCGWQARGSSQGTSLRGLMSLCHQKAAPPQQQEWQLRMMRRPQL